MSALPTDSLAFALLAAARIDAAVLAGQSLADGLLGRVDALARPAVQDLVYGSLRQYGRGDFLLARLLAKPLDVPEVRTLLLVALYRLETRPDAAHTVVDQAVAAAGELASGRFRGLVNGVLRNFLRRREELLALAEADEVAHWRHPAWWIAQLRRDHPAHWQDLLAAGNSHPPMCLRANRRKYESIRDASPAQLLLAQLAAAGIAARALDETAVLLEKPLPLDRISGFASGLCSVQDSGAQAAARLLDARDGMRVLDACAAPGGKAAHLLERADIELTALDSDVARVARIGENLQRLGLAATVKVADARDPDAWWDGRPFDRILADVPCSASGVVRRHPDAKWLRRESDIAGFVATQKSIIDALWRTLAPGGTMLYATCSVFAAENRIQVEGFLGRHPDARLAPGGRSSPGDAYQIPDAEHDGFFYALLQKA